MRLGARTGAIYRFVRRLPFRFEVARNFVDLPLLVRAFDLARLLFRPFFAGLIRSGSLALPVSRFQAS